MWVRRNTSDRRERVPGDAGPILLVAMRPNAASSAARPARCAKDKTEEFRHKLHTFLISDKRVGYIAMLIITFCNAETG